MAEEQKEAVPVEENVEELEELLDSALKDFGKTKNTDDELDALMDLKDQDAAKKAAAEFQAMLAQMLQVQEEAIKTAQENDGILPDGTPLPSLDDDSETKAIMDAMKQLMDCSGQVANAQTPGEFLQHLDALRGPESPIEPFMAMMMQTLASKDVMYPPLKEIHDAYPKYLEENAASLDQETRTRYEKQYEIIGRICTEFEKQPDTPADPSISQQPNTELQVSETAAQESANAAAEAGAVCMAQFETLGKLLVELQVLGYPPKELVGALPPGWATDADGMPKVEDVTQAADACSIM